MNKSAELPRWHLHRRLYNWALSFAHSPHSTIALFLLSALESFILPVVPDIILIPMSLERPKRIWYYAFIATISSVVGGIIGYWIGAQIWDWVSSYFFSHVFSEASFYDVERAYQTWDFWTVFFGALSPAPYKLFTVTAGVFDVSFATFIIASVLGRGIRFYLLAILLWRYGTKVSQFIDKYFHVLTVATLVFLAILFIFIKGNLLAVI